MPVADFNGAVTLTLTTDDGGNTGAGGAQTDVDTSTITVVAVNDAPVSTLPPSYSTNEDTLVGLTGISLSDIDAGSGTMTATFGVTSGTLTAISSGGVTVSGSGTSSLMLSGTAPGEPEHILGRSVATELCADSRLQRSGDADADDQRPWQRRRRRCADRRDTSTITVAAVTDIVNDSATTNEDTAVTLSVLSNDTFSDPGRTITGVNGAAITAGGAGVSVTGGAVTLNMSGQLIFMLSANYNGTPSFTYTVRAGGVTETGTVNVTVDPVNDAPVNTLPLSYSTNGNASIGRPESRCRMSMWVRGC